MNLALTDEQEFLREAARGALARFKTVEAAREALEHDDALPDLWPVVVEAGWPGLLIAEEQGGAGLHVFDAMLVAEEVGRNLASAPVLGLLPATFLLDAAGDESLATVAAGEVRPVYVPASPPSDHDDRWTVDAPKGMARAAAPTIAADGSVTGTVAWVPDAPGADLFVVVGTGEDGSPAAAVVEGAQVEKADRYDATRSLGHVTFAGTAGRRLAVDEATLRNAWYVAQCILGAESLGTVATTLEMSVQYAKERFTFGRPIGSYQAVKHSLVEVLRRKENLLSLVYYAGWAGEANPQELPLAASAARTVANGALDYATRELISVHGGIGATWEHDAPLFFRRAQLSKLLLGGAHDSADRVADQLLTAPGVLSG